jgi:hypothetical protein
MGHILAELRRKRKGAKNRHWLFLFPVNKRLQEGRIPVINHKVVAGQVSITPLGVAMQDRKADIVLSVGTDIKFLPLVLSFTESSSRIFGLEDRDALKLTLASEEMFAYLCGMTGEARPVTLTMENGFYYALLRFAFDNIDFDPRAFNLTASVSPDEEGLGEMASHRVAFRGQDVLIPRPPGGNGGYT